jgi:hypothetical protein
MYGQAHCLPESCPKNGDAPKSPLLTIGSLVPSVGTNRSQQLMLVWIAESAELKLFRGWATNAVAQPARQRGNVMIEKFNSRRTLAGRAIGCLLAAMVVNVLVGTAPASAQVQGSWTYAWAANGKCCMTMTPPTSPYYYAPCNPPIWHSATKDRCRNVGIPVGSSTPSLAAKILIPNNDRFPLGGGGRGQSNSQGNSFPGKR